jgi:GNAT superfamily N-acetyltransferase
MSPPSLPVETRAASGRRAVDVAHAADANDAGRRWIPILELAPRHRAAMHEHLRNLDLRSRQLRFGAALRDEQIESYIEAIDFDRDEVFGVFGPDLRLVGLAHLAYFVESPCDAAGDLPPAAHRCAEFGVSVDSCRRGRGIGARLLDHAVLHARNRGATALVIHALAENAAMLRIARAAGAELRFDGCDATGSLALPPPDLASHVEAIVQRQLAEFDCLLKVEARRLHAWLAAIATAAAAAD